MKVLQTIMLVALCLISSTLAYTYYELDPTPDSTQLKLFTDAAAALNPTANEIVATDAVGDVIKIDCASRTSLTEALQRDSSTGTHKHGSCCLNSHHRICQNIQAQIREKCSAHTGKGDTSTDTTGTDCPA